MLAEGKRSVRKEDLLQCHFEQIIFVWTGTRLNPGLRVMRPKTNRTVRSLSTGFRANLFNSLCHTLRRKDIAVKILNPV